MLSASPIKLKHLFKQKHSNTRCKSIKLNPIHLIVLSYLCQSKWMTVLPFITLPSIIPFMTSPTSFSLMLVRGGPRSCKTWKTNSTTLFISYLEEKKNNNNIHSANMNKKHYLIIIKHTCWNIITFLALKLIFFTI